MDTKRLILAFVLIMGFLWIYNTFIVPPVVKPAMVQETIVNAEPSEVKPASGQTNNQNVMDMFKKDTSAGQVAKETPAQTPVSEALVAAKQSDQIVVDTPLYRARFSNKGAGLLSFQLKGYTDDISFHDKAIAAGQKPPLDLVHRSADQNGIYPFFLSPFEGDELLIGLNQALYTYGDQDTFNVSSEAQTLTFRYADPVRNVSIEKSFIFHADSYRIDVAVKLVQNGQERLAPIVFGPNLENGVITDDRGMQLMFKVGAYTGSDIVSQEFKDVKTLKMGESLIETASGQLPGQFYWSAFETTYFAAVFRTDPRQSQVKYTVLRKQVPGKEKNGKEIMITETYAYMIVDHTDMVFFGPKDEQVIDTLGTHFTDLHKVIEYGWFGTIAKWMLKGIQFAYGIVPNYGWAIILFTIFLKLVLFPLTYTSSVSMAKMQALQPKIKALKKKYKNVKDPEQRRNLNVETMDLYKREKVNPAGGCLPLLLQMPILWGFFRLLAVSINVRHEPWIFWFQDLSIKDPSYILPILFGVTQILIQKMTPATGDAAQRKIMYLMPVFFTFIVLNLPSGLTLYWFVSNLLQLGQQQIINNKVHQTQKEEVSERKKDKRKALQ